MVKPVFRRKSIGTKVSEEEYARLEALAGGRAMSEWAAISRDTGVFEVMRSTQQESQLSIRQPRNYR
ncbi:MAG: hypothetical protein ACRD3O_16215 [Terriglobia bacterium]